MGQAGGVSSASGERLALYLRGVASTEGSPHVYDAARLWPSAGVFSASWTTPPGGSCSERRRLFRQAVPDRQAVFRAPAGCLRAPASCPSLSGKVGITVVVA